MKRLAAALVLLSSVGCFGRGDVYEPGDIVTPVLEPGTWHDTPEGVRVLRPIWLTDEDDWRTVLTEIRETRPQIDTRIGDLPKDAAGVPKGYTVYIHPPTHFSSHASDTGLATGQTDMVHRMWVAYKYRHAAPPLLPALAHELGHVYYQLHYRKGVGANH